MGSCVSLLNHTPDGRPTPLGLRRNSKEVLLIAAASSPLKWNRDTVNPGVPFKSQPSPVRSSVTAGSSKDEAFFDSQPWLDSDCDDDFLSVNGDGNGSPSGGSTPGSVPSPQVKKKRLSQLFRADDHDSDTSVDTGLKVTKAESAISLMPQKNQLQANVTDRRRPPLSSFRSNKITSRCRSSHLAQQQMKKPSVKSGHSCCLPPCSALG